MSEPANGDLRVLAPELNEGYLDQRLPAGRDRDITALLGAAAEKGRLADLARVVRPPQVPVLLAFAERMASLAARSAEVAPLRWGLLAAGTAAAASDPRDVLLILPLLWRSAERLQLDPAAEFREAARRLPAAAGMLEQFIGRSPEDRAIEAMGYIEASDGDGFRYERTW